MNSRRLRSGFTLLEVMIAMSILAIGATSILSIFVAAVRFQTDRMEENRVMEIYNVAREHADILFSNFDPSLVEEGQPPFPKPVVADLRDEDKAREHPDPRVRQAARKFRGGIVARRLRMPYVPLVQRAALLFMGVCGSFWLTQRVAGFFL